MGKLERLARRWRYVKVIADRLAVDPSSVRRQGLKLLLFDQLGVRSPDTSLALHAFGRRFEFTTNNVGDFNTLFEVFVSEEYSAAGVAPPVRTIIDLGSNVGASVSYFRLAFPDAHIFGYEPDRRNLALLTRNVRQFEGVEVYHAAVGAEDGEADFFEHGSRGFASSVARQTRDQTRTNVAVRSLDTVLAGHDEVDLLKFDVEGAEYDIFRSSRLLGKVRTLIGEVHLDMIPVDLNTFCNLFPSHAVRTTQIEPQRYLLTAERMEADSPTPHRHA